MLRFLLVVPEYLYMVKGQPVLFRLNLHVVMVPRNIVEGQKMVFRLFGLYACMATCNRWLEVSVCPLPYTSTLERLGEILVLRPVGITLCQQLPILWWLRLYSYIEKGHIRRNLSAAACMDYTSPPMGQLFEARRAEFWTIGEISECKPYMSQRLDSLRRALFLYKSTA